jgi:membrane peptidoglycan carboxypeptidase
VTSARDSAAWGERVAWRPVTRLLPVVLAVALLSGCASTPPPEPPPPPATVVYYADGKTPLPDGPAKRKALDELDGLTRQSRAPGYAVTTTLDQSVQQSTTDVAALPGEPSTLQAAVVVVEPKTGRVVAYVGGAAGEALDYAGMAHPPAGSFAGYTLAAALRHNISPQSRWQSPFMMAFPGRATSVKNSGTCPDNTKTCTLADAVNGGLTVPLYAVAARVGAPAVVDTLRALGVEHLQATVPGAGGEAQPKMVDLRTTKNSDVVTYFGNEIGFGQYGVSVLDHANGLATFAAGGRRATARLVAEVRRSGTVVYREPNKTVDSGLTKAQLDNVTWTLSRNPAGRLDDGHHTAVTTGSWRLGHETDDLGNAWAAGYTDQYAVAVWVGNKGKEQPLKDKAGRPVTGATLPAGIYRSVMATVMAGKTWTEPVQPAPYGDPTLGNAGA